MHPIRKIDWELMGTMAMVFSAENVLERVFVEIFPETFLVQVAGWLFIFIVVTYLTAEEAEDNEEN